MGRRVLDQGIMAKLTAKLGKAEASINVMVSKLASKQGISSEAALVVLERSTESAPLFINVSLIRQNKAEIRTAIAATAMPAMRKAAPAMRTCSTKASNGTRPLRAAIEYLIQDPVLLSRCRDILLTSANFDRPINQATQVLEDRIRTKAQPPRRLTGENLVGFAFNEDISKTVLRVASGDPDDQRGLTHPDTQGNSTCFP